MHVSVSGVRGCVSLRRGDDDQDGARPLALSDTEVEVNDRRTANFLEVEKPKRKEHSSKVSWSEM